MSHQYFAESVDTISASFTRPANTTAYTAGDVVSNNATTSHLMRFGAAARFLGKGGYITKVRLTTSNKAFLSQMRLHLFSQDETGTGSAGGTPVTSVPGDNVPLTTLLANAPVYRGYIDFPFLATATDSTDSTAAVAAAVIAPFSYKCDSLDDGFYGLLEDRTGSTPTSGQTFQVDLSIDKA